MVYLVIIPARGGSKAIPKKNIADLNGQPLINYTIQAAKNSGLSNIIVSTDSEEIGNIAKNKNVDVHHRSKELSGDEVGMLPVLADVALKYDGEFDSIICLQPTSPFRTAKHIIEAKNLFETLINTDTLVSVVKVPHNMNPCSIMIERDGLLTPHQHQEKLILRRQDKESFFARNGPAILIIKKSVLESRQLYSDNVSAYVMDLLSSIDIDNSDDLKIANLIFKNNSELL
tara:strand:+ start:159 stop:848 length:690 start_codon:yes stop_codon:yes gene_type:complete